MAKQNEELVLTDTGTIETVEKKVPEQKTKVVTEPDFYLYQLTMKFARISDMRPPFPPTYAIGNEDLIYDEATQTERAIRYIEGVNTIYVDEQQHLPDHIKNRKPQLEFIDGFLRVPKQKKALIEYLNKTNRNESVKNRMPDKQPMFKLVNYNLDDSLQLRRLERKQEAMRVALSATEETMIPHAKFLNISFIDANANEKPVSMIKADYVKKAEQDPEFFLKTFNNPMVNANYLVKLGFEKNILASHIVKNQVHWAKTKQFIAIVPQGTTPVDFLTNFCFSEKGKEFYNKLKQLLDKE